MLVVKVELHSAITGEVEELAKGKIWNAGISDLETGRFNYVGEFVEFNILEDPNHPAIEAPKLFRTGEVKNYYRYHSVWNLVKEVLKSATEKA